MINFVLVLLSFEPDENTQFNTKTEQGDVSYLPTRKRPFLFEHPASLKQLKRSDDLPEAQVTSTPMEASASPLTLLGTLKPHSVIAEFLNITHQLQLVLQSYDTEAMLKQCENLMASNLQKISLFSSNQVQKFREYKNAPAFIQALGPYYNWSNHSVLREAVGACNNSVALNLLDQFDSQVDLSLPACIRLSHTSTSSQHGPL